MPILSKVIGQGQGQTHIRNFIDTKQDRYPTNKAKIVKLGRHVLYGERKMPLISQGQMLSSCSMDNHMKERQD